MYLGYLGWEFALQQGVFLAGVITNCIGLYHHFGAFAKLVIKVSFM